MEPLEEKVTGRRSPRWAVMQRMRISKPGYGLYLDRIRIIQTPLGGVYLHHIVRPDADKDPHDHPWPFGSLVLRGGYQEQFHPIPNVHINTFRVQRWSRWSWHRMGTETAHRITHVLGDTWTLVFVGRRRRTWGFFKDGTWFSWDEYEEMAK